MSKKSNISNVIYLLVFLLGGFLSAQDSQFFISEGTVVSGIKNVKVTPKVKEKIAVETQSRQSKISFKKATSSFNKITRKENKEIQMIFSRVNANSNVLLSKTFKTLKIYNLYEQPNTLNHESNSSNSLAGLVNRNKIHTFITLHNSALHNTYYKKNFNEKVYRDINIPPKI